MFKLLLIFSLLLMAKILLKAIPVWGAGAIGSEINVQNAEQDLKAAKLAISKFSENEKNPEKIKALNEVSKAEARIQAAKN